MKTTAISPSTTSQAILKNARLLKDKAVERRRIIHANPELSFQEHKTAAYVAAQLEEMGCRVTKGVGNTGVVAEIGAGGKLVAVRADMDALPIQETNQVSYRSQCTEVMHACGHDAHTACALTAAQILIDHLKKEKIAGRVRFLFQPAEEKVNEDGKSGATLLIESGATKDVEALVALHVHPGAPAGIVGVRNGAMLAACDSFDAVIKGKGSHGAEPELGVDAIVLASHAVLALQQVVSRRIAGTEPAIVTVGGFRSKTYAPNIISEDVEITGTVRYFNSALHTVMKTEIGKALSVVEALGGKLELDYRHESPPLVNDAAITAVVKQAAEEMLGPENVIEMPLHMGAEDFSFYTSHVPSCFFALGVGSEKHQAELHTSDFDIDENALPIGAAILVDSVLRLLSEQ